MDHQTIDQEQIVERYLLGRLSLEEAEAFEEHSLACDACLDRLEAAEGLRAGLIAVAAEDVARATALAGMAAWLHRWTRSRAAPWLLAAVFLVTLLPSGYLAWQQGELRDDLARAERESETAAREQDRRSAEFELLEGRLSAARERLEREQGERQRERLERDELADRLQGVREAPRLNVPILSLGPERSLGGEPPVLALPEDGWAVLALEPSRLNASSYEVRLVDATGREVWRGSGLRLDPVGTVTLTLPGTLLRPGRWALELTEAGSGAEAGRFPVTVRRVG